MREPVLGVLFGARRPLDHAVKGHVIDDNVSSCAPLSWTA
jgi:hypothetical protein